jgi:type I restriction enzyme, S subunit
VSELPNNWIETALTNLAMIEMGQSPDSRSYNAEGKGLPFFQGKSEFQAVFPEIRKWCSEPTKVVEHGDILLSIRAPVGPTNIAPEKSCIGRGLAGIRGEVGINQSYLYYFFKSIGPWLSEQGTGSTFAAISGQFVRDISCPVAPCAEQTRIVAKLEELLSDLDAGVAELKAAQQKLAQYRQSLLKAAVEGALTAAWREQNKPTETGAQLLERILQERRARWEAKQLAKFKEQGKTPPKDWQKKYPEPVQPDTTDLPELPQGWVWASVDQLTVEQKYGSSSKTNEDPTGVPVLRMGNIQDGDLDFANLKYLPVDHDEFPSLHLQDGDLLFNRTNSPELVGKTAVYRSQMTPCSFASYLIGVRFSESYVSELASAFINSAYGKRWIKSVVVQQVGQANVNGSKLSALAVPVPPLEEQQEIISALHAQTNEIVGQLKSVEMSLKQSNAQRQNILRAAFAGRLVPQDPNDEPASALLERIRAERAAQAAVKKPRGRKNQEAA